jgi:hypothetical protein
MVGKELTSGSTELIWIGYIARLSQWGGGGYFTCSNDFYLHSLRREGVGKVSTLWVGPKEGSYNYTVKKVFVFPVGRQPGRL